MADTKQYITQQMENGNVMISEDVIATIVAHAVKEVDGVAGLSAKPGVDAITKKGWGKGIKVTINQQEQLSIDCYVMVAYGRPVVAIATAAQEAITSAVESATGIKVRSVNVNVSGIVRD